MPSFLCGSLSSSAATPPRRRRPLRRRVLLLGIGGAGKSTIFRQIQRPPMSYKDLQSLKTTIHNLVIAAIKSLVDGAALLSQTHPSVQTTLPENSSIQRSVQYVTEELEFDRELLPKAARHIANLWAHPAIQRTYELRYHFGIHIPDSAPYFFDKINTITALGYVPSSMDFIHCTVKSSGITDTITDDGLQFLDLGGRRTERRKWTRCFDSVVGVVFVASLGDFMEPLEEDPTVNRLAESVAVFEEIANNPLCQGVLLVVSFTKTDLFSDALRRWRLQDLYPEYSGGADPQKAFAFIKSLFLSKVRRQSTSSQIVFQTCNAIDRTSSNVLIRTIRDVIRHTETPTPAGRTKL